MLTVPSPSLIRFFWSLLLVGMAVVCHAAPSIGVTAFNSPASGGFVTVGNQTSPRSVNYLGYTFTGVSTGNISLSHAASRINMIVPSGLLTYYQIGSDDGSEFQLNSFNFRVLVTNYVRTWTITGYRNGSPVSGATATFDVLASATDYTFDVSSNVAFDYIDAYRLTASVGGTGTLAINSINISAGVAPASAPTVTTPTSSSVTHVAATLGGNVTSDGGATVSARGVVASPTSTNSNPQIGGNGVLNFTGTGTTGVFTVSATGLSASTAYTYAAYATNAQGTSYSSTGTFTTSAPPDTTPPSVIGVSASTGNGAYNAGDTIVVQITFSENVIVTGTPQLTLETGTTDRVVNFTSGSGSSVLVFNYTVQAGDNSSDLDYVSTSSLAFNGGTIQDAAGNNATLTLASPGAAGSLGANKSLVIDTTPPTVAIGAPSVSTTKAGPVSYTVTYSGQNSISLNVLDLTINTTGSAVVSSYQVSGSGSTRTVTLESITGDGTVGFSIASGTASDTAGNTAAAAGPSTTFTVDNTAPTISIGAPSTSLTKSGPVSYTVTYSGQTSISFDVLDINFHNTGNVVATGYEVSGSGNTRTVTFDTITGDGTLVFSIDAGTASDAVGNSAAASAQSTAVTVDNTAPTISSSLTDSGTYRSSYSYTITASGAPVSFGASGLPAGLSVDGGSGAISGTPTVSGPFSITLSATDAAGNVGGATLELTLAKVGLTVTGVTAADKNYDAGLLASINAASASLVGVLGGDDVTLNAGSAAGTFADANVGTGKTVTISGLALAGGAAGNYTLTQPTTTADIDAVQLTVTADAKVRPYGYGNPTLTSTITGFVGGETSTVLSGAPALGTTATTTSVPGAYTITAAVGTLGATNYTFAFVNGTLTVRLLEIADWEEENFTPSELLDNGISGPGADPDLDGVTNLYEYAFGTDPNDNMSGPNDLQYSGSLAAGINLVEEGQPIRILEVVGGVNQTRVLFLRRKAAFTSDLIYTPGFSANGTVWVTSPSVPAVLADAGIYELVSVPYPATTGGKKTRFFRVLAELF